MGVYVIQSLHANWIKIGHHKISHRRPNVYYRYINRGFFSCICPKEIKDKVAFEDLKLLYWFPNLTTRHEKKIHKYLRESYRSTGEWFQDVHPETLRSLIIDEFEGVEEQVTEEDLIKAKEWCNYKE